MRLTGIVVTLLVVAVFAAAAAAGEAAKPVDHDSLAEALKAGTFSVSLRYRFEEVSDDAAAVAAKNAHASTLRTTASYGSGLFHGFSLLLEFEDVTDIGLEDQHNNAGAGALGNGVGDRPVIADPDLTEVNQAYLAYAGIPKTTIRAGRQTIVLGTQRFVGPVGWRQNHQSFDAVRADIKAIPRTKLTYAFVDRVQRIFGDDKPMKSHLLDAEVKIGENGALTPYAYVLDYDDAADAGLSTATFGVRWQNAWDPEGPWSMPYQVELAQQSDTGDNPGEVDAGYAMIELGGKRGPVWFKAGYELLEGSVGQGAFATPLATLHKFNGWADKFLSTPSTGLEDLYVAVGAEHKGLNAILVFHDFTSDSGSIDYGQELNLQVLYKAPWKQTFGIAAAGYEADQFAADTVKLWVWTAYAWGS